MKIWEKMNELVNSNGDKDVIKRWAYNNRIMVMSIHDEEEFEVLEKSVDAFIEAFGYHGKADEHESWDAFLEFEFVE